MSQERGTGYITEAHAGFQEDRDLGCMGQFDFGAGLDEEGAGSGLSGTVGNSQVGEKQLTPCGRVVEATRRRGSRGEAVDRLFLGSPVCPSSPRAKVHVVSSLPKQVFLSEPFRK